MTALTQYAQKRVVASIKEQIMNGYSFTSLDIANELKDDGVRLRNRDVAEMLRSMVLPIAHKYHCLYNITLIRVDSKDDGPTWAYVYHHKNNSADDYLARDQNPKSFKTQLDINPRLRSDYVKAVRQQVKTAVANAAAKSDPHWKSQKRDALGRFC